MMMMTFETGVDDNGERASEQASSASFWIAGRVTWVSGSPSTTRVVIMCFWVIHRLCIYRITIGELLKLNSCNFITNGENEVNLNFTTLQKKPIILIGTQCKRIYIYELVKYKHKKSLADYKILTWVVIQGVYLKLFGDTVTVINC